MTAPQSQPPYSQYPSPGYIPPPPAPPRKRHIGRWVVMGLGALVVVIIGSTVSTHPTQPASPTTTPAAPAANPGAGAPATNAPAAPAGHHVVYKITATTSTAANNITYNSDGIASIQQETGAKIPWTKELDFPADQPLSIAQLSVQNDGGGTITCEIDVDGQVVKTGTASGQYAIASCNATIK